MVTSTEQAIEAIRLRAKENGFKMNDIAQAAGVDPAQLSRWSTGKTVPLYSSITKLSDAVDALIAAKVSE
jgi:transcriptional regulator with XRE-family HTH domain